MSPLFFISRSRSLSPFFSLSFAGLPPTFSFSLSFSCSIFQICGHDNYSELNTLENTDTETISAFRLLSCLCFTRTRGYAISRQNNLELHLGCHTCWLSYFTLVCLWCGRTVGRSVGVRSRDYQIVYHIFLPMVLRARELRYYLFWSFVCSFLFIPAACGWEFHTSPYKRMSILSILRFLGLCAALNCMMRYQWQWSESCL